MACKDCSYKIACLDDSTLSIYKIEAPSLSGKWKQEVKDNVYKVIVPLLKGKLGDIANRGYPLCILVHMEQERSGFTLCFKLNTTVLDALLSSG